MCLCCVVYTYTLWIIQGDIHLHTIKNQVQSIWFGIGLLFIFPRVIIVCLN